MASPVDSASSPGYYAMAASPDPANPLASRKLRASCQECQSSHKKCNGVATAEGGLALNSCSRCERLGRACLYDQVASRILRPREREAESSASTSPESRDSLLSFAETPSSASTEDLDFIELYAKAFLNPAPQEFIFDEELPK